ncbi:MAG TPA: transcriptional regulator [Verrucomicrobiae bacterium]|nr:transcriptional regulator [Verrucomicrobiae bacterium]
MLPGVALIGYAQASLPATSMWRHGFLSILFMYLILVPALALGYGGGKAIRKHITWPRTGYVAYSGGGKVWWTGVVFSFVIAAVIAAGFTCVLLFARRHAMNKGNLSSHLARLEEAGYVEIEKTYRGKVPQTLLRLTRAGRAAFE